MTSCPCGSTTLYSHCCEPIHLDHSKAITPEQLMRARYSAHVHRLVDFIVNTYHPSCHAELEREGIAESANSDWCKLDVISTGSGTNESEGFVTFKAYFNQDGQQFCLEECSRFVRENDLWYYIDGRFPEEQQEIDPRLLQSVKELKVGRNDPCICGSGKKFKKCCG